ncbi:hypothetical protein E3Q22_03328 [Wallemia mellicola]|uniref:DNA mismatch repair proteins mutS family domain-containing protein n=1 Tax=Wallemia mellicola TaxID=1708541 RepID=A0A4T0M2I0_9BASI|nr:hypothetical protein E3Q22_03328 [Wallemia mellicola]
MYRTIIRNINTSKIKISLPKKPLEVHREPAKQFAINPFGYHSDQLSSDLLRNVVTTINNHPDALVLTKVGGFYEAYYDHALELSKLLSFSLGDKSYNKTRFPMSGFPAYQLQKHLRTLVVDHSLFVAINDQFFNHTTGTFDRRVTRVVTPGTLLDESSLNPNTHNFILSVIYQEPTQQVALSWSDISTGDSYAETCKPADLKSYLARLSPSEIVLDIQLTPSQSSTLQRLMGSHDATVTYAPMQESKAKRSKEYTPLENAAISLLQSRIKTSLIKNTPEISPMRDLAANKLILDAQTIKGLELKSTIRDNRAAGSLLKAVRRTCTQHGHRMLERWLCEPSSEISKIRSRHDCVDLFKSRFQLRRDLRGFLKDIEDGPRLLQRIVLASSFKPSLLLSVKRVIEKSQEVVNRIQYEHKYEGLHAKSTEWSSLLELTKTLKPLIKFANKVDQVIIEDALRAKDTDELENEGEAEPEETKRSNSSDIYNDDFKRSITPRYSPRIAQLNKKLDKLYKSRDELAKMVRNDFKVTDSSQVLLRSNQKLGHYITARKNGNKDIPSAYQVVASQKSTASYSHPQWTSIKSAIIDTSEELEKAEREALTSLKDELSAQSEAFKHNNNLISQLDVLLSFAELAEEKRWTRPHMTTDRTLDIKTGRHPSVEIALQDSLNSFTPNDTYMDDKAYINAIFGPNMGGKSTYLRQNAIIVVLAQAGSFVPADKAVVGVVDRVFSRIGASDDLSGGRSTFMVEMTEAAEILSTSTPRSLVIMDEIGRGTTSVDGLSLAYAMLIHLATENKSRTLFATHFHELDDMLDGQNLPVRFLSTDLDAGPDGFAFTYTMREGVCKDSHGLIVAKLAGVPDSCIAHAEEASQKIKNR